MTALQAKELGAALFAGMVKLRQAPVNEPQFPLLVVDHHLPTSIWRRCYEVPMSHVCILTAVSRHCRGEILMSTAMVM